MLPEGLSQALIQMGAAQGVRLELVEAAIRVNQGQRVRILEKIERLVGGLRGKPIGVLGLAFKPNTDDVREAPSIDLIDGLLARGALVKAFDPAAMDQVAAICPSVEMCQDAYSAAEGCDAVVLMTEWNQFRNLEMSQIRESLRSPVFVDCRNVYDSARTAELGFVYEGIDRPAKRAG